jgi:hypothetical protein
MTAPGKRLEKDLIGTPLPEPCQILAEWMDTILMLHCEKLAKDLVAAAGALPGDIFRTPRAINATVPRMP